MSQRVDLELERVARPDVSALLLAHVRGLVVGDDRALVRGIDAVDAATDHILSKLERERLLDRRRRVTTVSDLLCPEPPQRLCSGREASVLVLA